ncbi:hypothetical protein [Actinosynnema sp. NPDC020468]|uniref:hypothetical protein n=1 Tax=Actinosynnema sp. NPDC020468 TaxID=3154488 RepID=UPI0033ED0FE3
MAAPRDEPVGSDLVAHLRRVITASVDLDQRQGGTSAAPVVLRAYREARRHVEAAGIRRGHVRDVHSALAELAEVAGWSLFDAGLPGSATLVNRAALEHATRAGDRGMALFVRQNQALLAEHEGAPRTSIDLADRALADRLSPRLEALFRLRLARSHALLGHDVARRHLIRARDLFGEGPGEDDPHWAWWVDDAQLTWFAGAVELHLGRRTASVDHFERAAAAEAEPRMSHVYRSWALYAFAVTGSWTEVDRLLHDLLTRPTPIRSHLAHRRLTAALDVVDRRRAPGSTRDLAHALRASGLS